MGEANDRECFRAVLAELKALKAAGGLTIPEFVRLYNEASAVAGVGEERGGLESIVNQAESPDMLRAIGIAW